MVRVTLTMGDNGKKSRGWGTTGLLAVGIAKLNNALPGVYERSVRDTKLTFQIFVLEVCVRAVNYEPPLPFFDKMIPHEMVHYAQL